MKKTTVKTVLPLLVLAGALAITAAFAQSNKGTDKRSFTDTLPKKEKKIRNLDEAMDELDKGEAEMNKALRDVDAGAISRQVEEAMKNVEVDKVKMKEEIDQAMKELDVQKIKLEIQKSMTEAQKELAKVDMEKIQKQVQESLASVDVEKMKADLEKVKEIDFSKMKKELEKMQPQIEKSMQEAKKGLAKARQELTDYKNLVAALDKDGYLNKDANYSVKYKGGELIVNGKTLSSDAVKKYSQYLSNKKDFTLQKSEDGLDINND